MRTMDLSDGTGNLFSGDWGEELGWQPNWGMLGGASVNMSELCTLYLGVRTAYERRRDKGQ